MTVSETRHTISESTAQSIRSYAKRPTSTRVVADVVACGAGLAVWFAVGGQAAWTAVYFGAVMCAWVLSDFASNLLFLPNDRTALAIEADRNVGATLLAENLALATWLLPFGLLTSLAVCAGLGRMGDYPCAAVGVIAVVGGWFGIGDLVSVASARVPMGMAAVRGGPKAWRREARRGMAYFGTMFLLGPLACAPAYAAFYYALYHHDQSRWYALAAALAWSALVWLMGWNMARRRIPQHREQILAVLEQFRAAA